MAGQIPSKKVYEDERVLALYDVNPQAPVHVLIIPKDHCKNLVDAREMGDDFLAHLLRTAAEVAITLGLDTTGFRIVSNCGADACQTVPHLHIHLLGGGRLSGTMA